MAQEDKSTLLLLLAKKGSITSVDVRRKVFAIERIPVIPDNDDAEVGGRGVDSRSVANDDVGSAVVRAQKVAVAFLVALTCVQSENAIMGQQCRRSRLKLFLITKIRRGQDGGCAPSESLSRQLDHRDRPTPYPHARGDFSDAGWRSKSSSLSLRHESRDRRLVEERDRLELTRGLESRC